MEESVRPGNPFDVQDASTWIIFVVFTVALSVSLNALISFSAQQATAARANQLQQRNMHYSGARLYTKRGVISIQFHHRRAPLTVDNFIKLARRGFYDGMRFHRAIDGTLIQAGDPLSKNISRKQEWGSGGPGYTLVNENSKAPVKRGTVVTVRESAEVAAQHGSQFFILLSEEIPQLNKGNTAFAQVRDGMDTLQEIASLSTNSSGIPNNPVVIKRVTLY